MIPSPIRLLTLFVTALLCSGLALVCGACTPNRDPAVTTAANDGEATLDTANTAEPVTTAEPATTAAPETEPPLLWEVDTGTFNEGKVTYAKDGEGRITATPTEGNTLGLDVTDKTDLVSICYSVWFDYILRKSDTGVDSYHDISKILAGEQEWGGSPSFHYWSKPALGYYCSSNREVIRTHMTQLYTAGVDFIILDHTNLGYGTIENPVDRVLMVDAPMTAIFETIMEMRAEGLGTPYVVVWVGGGGDERLYNYLYDNFYGQEKWADCFVYWDGKPFLLTTTLHDETNPAPAQFTTRCMGGLLGLQAARNGQWNFLALNNAKFCTENAEGEAEQIPVCVAAQETYMSADTAHGRIGGLFWYAQWQSAFQFRPKFVTLTWWNEWTAQRLYIQGGAYDGQYHFTDAYSPEYSRDIEPMEGGHGDQYYRWMIEYIAAYKNHKDCPMLVEEEYLQEENREAVDIFLKKFSKGKSERTPW